MYLALAAIGIYIVYDAIKKPAYLDTRNIPLTPEKKAYINNGVKNSLSKLKDSIFEKVKNNLGYLPFSDNADKDIAVFIQYLVTATDNELIYCDAVCRKNLKTSLSEILESAGIYESTYNPITYLFGNKIQGLETLKKRLQNLQ